MHIFIYLILFFLGTCLVAKYWIQTTTIKDLEIQIENLKLENENIQELLDKYRLIKHDYYNKIAVIQGYANAKNIDGLSKYLKKLISNIDSIKVIQSISLENINEPAIFNLIAIKYKEAMKNKINFIFQTSIDYNSLALDIYEFTKILGIFLDNAIYNAKLSKEKEIILLIECANNSQVLTVKNSYVNKDIDLDKIFEKGFSTKENKSGLGLWEVKNVLDTIPNAVLETTKDDKYFIQELTMYSCENDH